MSYDYSQIYSHGQPPSGLVSARHSHAISARTSTSPSECPQYSSADTARLRQDAESIATAMGMDETCKQVMSNSFENQATSTSASMSIDAFIASAQASASFATGSASGESSAFQQGCERAVANVFDQQTSIANLNCIIARNTQQVHVNFTANSSITIDATCPLTPELAALRQTRERQYTATQQLIFREMGRARGDAVVIAALERAQQNHARAYIETSGSARLRNSNLTTSITSLMRVNNTLSETDAAEIETNLQSIASAVAENEVRNQLGVGAVTPSARELTSSTVTSEAMTSNASINETMSSTNANMDVSGSITISSCNGVLVDGSTMDSNIEVSMVVEQLANIARERGMNTAQTVVNQTRNTRREDNIVRGADDLADAANAGNDVIVSGGQSASHNARRHLEGGNNNMIIAAVVVVAVIMMMMMNKNKKE
jgi:hypothetical protein